VEGYLVVVIKTVAAHVSAFPRKCALTAAWERKIYLLSMIEQDRKQQVRPLNEMEGKTQDGEKRGRWEKKERRGVRVGWQDYLSLWPLDGPRKKKKFFFGRAPQRFPIGTSPSEPAPLGPNRRGPAQHNPDMIIGCLPHR
jgi:hypothetical protein